MDSSRIVGELFASFRDGLAADVRLGDQPDLSEVASEPIPAIEESPPLRALRSFDDRIVHPDLIALCRIDFVHQRYANASRQATQYLSQDVLDRCRAELRNREESRARAAGRLPDVLRDGSALMQQVFAVENPVLQVPPQMVLQSDRSEQIGYGQLMQGVIGAFRNPRSHDVFYEDDPFLALLIIELIQHLLEVASASTLIQHEPSAVR
jgi:uncharacterized protein (TIGR02391 family)